MKLLNKIKKLPIALKLLGIIIILGLSWFVFIRHNKSQTGQNQYQTAKAEKGTLVASVTASGQVSSANNTPVVTQVTGTITKLYVKNGDQIKAGSPIATIELDQASNQKYIQQYASWLGAKNSLESAKTSLKTLKNDMLTAEQNFIKQALNKNKDEDSVTYQQLKALKDAALAKYENQPNVIKQAETSLNNAALSLQQVSPTIYAPISGKITGLPLQVGSVIPAQAVSSSSSNQITSQNIATITTSAYPIVTIDLTEIDVPKVKVGNLATVTFDAFPGKTFTGKVFSINTTGSVSSGVTTYPTTITLDTENPDIYSNMSASASIIVDTKENTLYVPSAAIQTQNGSTVVRMLKNNEINYIEVETGISSDTSTEIISGLSEGDEVVTSVITNTTKSGSTTGASPFGVFRTGGGGGAMRRD